jgi:NADP-dependent 3-hydroxy acid dehydrogenase YdfG
VSALSGRYAVVTGGGSGIGLACARMLRGAGADVLIVGRRAERLQAAADSIGAHGGRAM